jgi:hypothetical protein
MQLQTNLGANFPFKIRKSKPEIRNKFEYQMTETPNVLNIRI